jgi:coatomer protein complex subunit epsilon
MLTAQLVLAEISSSSPIALQAVKQLALYMKDSSHREAVLEQVAGWLTDMSCTNNATVLLVAGLIYLTEENYVEALKCCHSGLSLEM